MTDIDLLKQMLHQGRLSRREFLAQAAAMGITAATATSLMGTTALAAMPKKGGNFRLGTAGGSTTDSLDPATWENTWIQIIGHGLHNYLTEITATGELVAELAESWDASDDAAAWTFKIRKGVDKYLSQRIGWHRPHCQWWF